MKDYKIAICFEDYFNKGLFNKNKIWMIFVYAPFLAKHINKKLKHYYKSRYGKEICRYIDNDKYICIFRKWYLDEFYSMKNK